eukprot:PhM_4_TR18827/c3_g2_i1/m.95740
MSSHNSSRAVPPPPVLYPKARAVARPPPLPPGHSRSKYSKASKQPTAQPVAAETKGTPEEDVTTTTTTTHLSAMFYDDSTYNAPATTDVAAGPSVGVGGAGVCLCPHCVVHSVNRGVIDMPEQSLHAPDGFDPAATSHYYYTSTYEHESMMHYYQGAAEAVVERHFTQRLVRGGRADGPVYFDTVPRHGGVPLASLGTPTRALAHEPRHRIASLDDVPFGHNMPLPPQHTAPETRPVAVMPVRADPTAGVTPHRAFPPPYRSTALADPGQLATERDEAQPVVGNNDAGRLPEQPVPGDYPEEDSCDGGGVPEPTLPDHVHMCNTVVTHPKSTLVKPLFMPRTGTKHDPSYVYADSAIISAVVLDVDGHSADPSTNIVDYVALPLSHQRTPTPSPDSPLCASSTQPNTSVQIQSQQQHALPMNAVVRTTTYRHQVYGEQPELPAFVPPPDGTPSYRSALMTRRVISTAAAPPPKQTTAMTTEEHRVETATKTVRAPQRTSQPAKAPSKKPVAHIRTPHQHQHHHAQPAAAVHHHHHHRDDDGGGSCGSSTLSCAAPSSTEEKAGVSPTQAAAVAVKKQKRVKKPSAVDAACGPNQLLPTKAAKSKITDNVASSVMSSSPLGGAAQHAVEASVDAPDAPVLPCGNTKQTKKKKNRSPPPDPESTQAIVNSEDDDDTAGIDIDVDTKPAALTKKQTRALKHANKQKQQDANDKDLLRSLGTRAHATATLPADAELQLQLAGTVASTHATSLNYLN